MKQYKYHHLKDLGGEPCNTISKIRRVIWLNYSKLQEFIKEYGQGDDFTGGVSEDKVKETELKLQVSLPDSYKWFLRNYGYGGLFGVRMPSYYVG